MGASSMSMRKSAWAKSWLATWKNTWGQVTDGQSPAGKTKGKRRGRPAWHFVPFHPVPAQRTRKKRDTDLLFLGV